MNTNKVLPADTSRLQLALSQKFLSNSTFESLHRSNQNTENQSQLIARRLKAHRHPLSGLSSILPELGLKNVSDPDVYLKETKHAQKLSPRILETWLNNTIFDAASLDVPEKILKAEAKQPLDRFGIDRTSLLNAGIQSSEIDRIYRSLFVYSIGFYQLVRRIIDHTDKKYTIITGLWKVYAILLEYCCQFDYEMIITTLDIEKKEELSQLETKFREQITKMEDHEKQLTDNINLSRQQLQQVQKDLMDEIGKREELEDELLQRGSGHEEEVTMRLQFESKLNQMYAKLRDMDSKILVLLENLEDLQKNVDDRTGSLQYERKKNLELMQFKIITEQESKKVSERCKQIETVNNTLEQRLADCYVKIEELSLNLSNANSLYNQGLNDLASKKIETENLKFSLEISQTHIEKLTALIDEHNIEKDIHIKRIHEVSSSLTQETNNNKHYQQEYVKIKEAEILNIKELNKYKDRSEEQEKKVLELEQERDTLRIYYESACAEASEYKDQLSQAQVKLEEMNKGRRIVEEKNEILKSRLESSVKEINEAKAETFMMRSEQEKFKNHETELLSTIATLNVNLHSFEKKYETTRSTLQDKINSLNDILESEKTARQN